MTRSPHCIIDIILDNRSIVAHNADVEVERHKVISDLLQDNSFRFARDGAAAGPYRLRLALEQDRLAIGVTCSVSGQCEDLRLPLAPLRKHVQDYVIICDNFYKAAREGQIHRLEAIDEGRRSIHDEAAEALAGALADKVVLDKMTARRLFSLVYVLHARQVNI